MINNDDELKIAKKYRDALERRLKAPLSSYKKWHQYEIKQGIPYEDTLKGLKENEFIINWTASFVYESKTD